MSKLLEYPKEMEIDHLCQMRLYCKYEHPSCEVCHDDFCATTEVGARIYARKAGWTIHDDNTATCPAHAAQGAA